MQSISALTPPNPAKIFDSCQQQRKKIWFSILQVMKNNRSSDQSHGSIPGPIPQSETEDPDSFSLGVHSAPAGLGTKVTPKKKKLSRLRYNFFFPSFRARGCVRTSSGQDQLKRINQETKKKAHGFTSCSRNQLSTNASTANATTSYEVH